MKKSITISFLALTTMLNAQIKIFPNGLQSYGSTIAPAFGEKHHFAGDVVVSQAGNTANSCALIRANSSTTGYVSSAARPDYTWLGDNNTGLFHPSSYILGFTINGTEAMRLYSNKKLFIGTQPNTGNPGLDGQLTIANPTQGERIFVANHNANADWQQAITTNLNRLQATSYGINLNGNATFYVTGAGWVYNAGGIYMGSDINIKDDIKTIDSASAKINKIKGVTYTYKREKQNPNLYGAVAKEYMGVIAQDIEKVAPQAVKVIHDGSKAVCYEMLIGLLIEGFKEQSTKIEQLQSDLNACCSKPNGGKTNRTSNTSNTENTGTDAQSYLLQNKPNPFNKQTVIDYNVVEEGTASILVFDMNGKLLKTIPVKIPGKGSITINANDFNPGMYYYSLIVNDKEVDTKKMILTN